MKTRIAIFATGSGSNARAIMEYFQGHSTIEVGLLLANKPNIGALEHADNFGIPKMVVEKHEFNNQEFMLSLLQKFQIEFIVLAGFLWLIPKFLVEAYHRKIVNIHPALLPKYGGKGMYGMHVHEAVKAAEESESGMTIHFVNDKYDKGDIIFQDTVEITRHDTASDIASKVLLLEHQHYARIIESVILDK